MEKTPVSRSKTTSSTRNVQETNPLYMEESPLQIASTQDGCDNMDVVWDWDSPQAKQRTKRTHKRLMLSQSPKIPMKRHPSNNAIQDFEKLQEELRLLKQQLAKPENEECLRLSPVEEAEYKSMQEVDDGYFQENVPQDVDFFDDSIDEQLLTFSRTIDNEMNNIAKPVSVISAGNNSNRAPPNNISNGTEKTAISTGLQRNTNYNPVSTGKVEFFRTQSFEESAVLSQDQLDEIEKRRLEAKAKREMKRKQETVISSPLKCSTEEIERKRLQALAKREAKRQEEFIERKRQEALKKRLEIRQRKDANLIKSQLASRLH